MSKVVRKTIAFKDVQKLSNTTNEYKIQCKCGTKTVIYPFENRTKKVCRGCGKYVYLNEKEEFKDTLKKFMKQQEEK